MLTEEDRRAAFAPFPLHLPVDAAGQRHRLVEASEFMLMNKDPIHGEYLLKHCGTRNYLIVHPLGSVVVPVDGGFFCRGFYGEAAT